MTGDAAPTTLTLAFLVAPKEDVLFQPLHDESVLLSLDSGQYFGLDAVGTRIWSLLAEGKPLAAIVPAIVDEYEVEAAQCEADLLKLIGDLEAQGLVRVTR